LELEKKYAKDGGVQIVKYRGNYQFSTSPDVADAVAAVLNPVREKNLTRAAMETMAIVAYKQPVTKLEIDEIRGVASDYAVHVLMENSLIHVVGRKDALGKPLLYGTTDEFLKRFELDNIDKLPSYDDLMDKLKTVAGNFDLYSENREPV
jgi:segregation and condensation protein B